MFRFAHNEILYLLLLIPVFTFLFIMARRSKKKAISQFGDLSVISQLMPLVSFKRPVFKFSMLMLAFAFIIVGLAGPQFGSKLQKVKRKGVEIVIALDVSNSMLANDIKPNRLEKAKRVISRLVGKLGDDKIGLVVFAGEAYTQLPITTDYSSARLFLSGINTDLVPIQGTAIGSAINLAANSFTPDSEASKAIVVITDGENHQDDAIKAAEAAREKGIIVHTIGMGLPHGAPVPIKGKPGVFRKDASGNVVVTKLDENMLRQIAATCEGSYIRADNTNKVSNSILKEINKMDKTLLESKVYAEYDERFQYFIIAGLFFLLVEYLLLGRKNKNFMKINIFGKSEPKKEDA